MTKNKFWILMHLVGYSYESVPIFKDARAEEIGVTSQTASWWVLFK